MVKNMLSRRKILYAFLSLLLFLVSAGILLTTGEEAQARCGQTCGVCNGRGIIVKDTTLSSPYPVNGVSYNVRRDISGCVNCGGSGTVSNLYQSIAGVGQSYRLSGVTYKAGSGSVGKACTWPGDFVISGGTRYKNCTVCGERLHTQHYLDIQAGPGIASTTGSGWYDAGTSNIYVSCTPYDGHHFVYWSDGDTRQSWYMSSAMDGPKTFTAYGDVNTYTMTMIHILYDPSTGTWNPNPYTYTSATATYGSVFTPSHISIGGYVSGPKDAESGWRVTGDGSFYVYYYPDMKMLSYDANGGSWVPAGQGITGGSTITLSTQIPSRPGYTFKYWYPDPVMENETSWGYSVNFNAPHIKRIRITKLNSTLFEVMVWADNTSRIAIPTWTTTNGQDDLVWTDLDASYWERGGEAYNFGKQISIADHNYELKHYTTHIYAYDAGGNILETQATGYYGMRFSPGDSLTAGNENITLYAQWDVNSYTLTLNSNGGNFRDGTSGTKTASPSLIYDSHNWEYVADFVPTRTGYTFNGFYDSLQGGTKVYGTDGWRITGTNYWNSGGAYCHPGNLNLYAQWDRNQYTVTYNANGGYVGNTTRTVYYRDPVDFGLTAEKTGQTFIGWSTDKNAKTVITNMTMPAGNVTLYAVYSIDVSDVANHTYPAYKVEKEKEVFLRVWEYGNPSGYRDYPLTYQYDTNRMVYKYTISQDVMNEVSGMNTYCYAVYAYDNAGNYREIKKGTVTRPGQPEPPGPGPEPEVEPVKYPQTVEHRRYDLSVKDWITFATTRKDVEAGKTFTPAHIEAPEGYRAAGMEYQDGYEESGRINPDGSYEVTEPAVSIAYYEPVEYTLTMDANGGSIVLDDGPVQKTEKDILYGAPYGQLPTPVRAGHTFAGWHTAETGGEKIKSSDTYKEAGNSTIYAQWTCNSYSVTYDYKLNEGTGCSVAGKHMEFGAEIDLSPIAEKTGEGLKDWEFVGWNTNPKATTAMNASSAWECAVCGKTHGINSMPNHEVTLFAIFQKTIKLTIVETKSYGVTDTTVLSETIYNDNKTHMFVIPQKNVYSGWTLLGYTTATEAKGTSVASVGGSYTTGESQTLYALYDSRMELNYDMNGSTMRYDRDEGSAYHNAHGAYEYPEFTVRKAPVLSDHSFVKWKAESGVITDLSDNVITSCNPDESILVKENATLKAHWDKHPSIEAYNRYFTLEQARNGEITEAELLRKVKARDEEAKTSSNPEGLLENGVDVIVTGYNPSDFMNLTADKKLEITYQATDSFGNNVSKTITVTVTDTTVKESNRKQYVRFIGSQFFADEEGMLLSADQGGLEETSVWRENTSYKELLQSTLSNRKSNVEKKTVSAFGLEWEIEVAGSGDWERKEETWVFTKQDIREMKAYTRTYGHILNAIDKFFELFPIFD